MCVHASAGVCTSNWSSVAHWGLGGLIHPGTSNWEDWDLKASYWADRVQQESTKEQKALDNSVKTVSSLNYRPE